METSDNNKLTKQNYRSYLKSQVESLTEYGEGLSDAKTSDIINIARLQFEMTREVYRLDNEGTEVDKHGNDIQPYRPHARVHRREKCRRRSSS